mgnify:CR=1 FL=1
MTLDEITAHYVDSSEYLNLYLNFLDTNGIPPSDVHRGAYTLYHIKCFACGRGSLKHVSEQCLFQSTHWTPSTYVSLT